MSFDRVAPLLRLPLPFIRRRCRRVRQTLRLRLRPPSPSWVPTRPCLSLSLPTLPRPHLDRLPSSSLSHRLSLLLPPSSQSGEEEEEEEEREEEVPVVDPTPGVSCLPFDHRPPE